MQPTSLEEKYFQLLAEYIADPSEEYLQQAADLGTELVQADYPPEDIVEFQESALNRFAREFPESTLAASWQSMTPRRLAMVFSRAPACLKAGSRIPEA